MIAFKQELNPQRVQFEGNEISIYFGFGNVVRVQLTDQTEATLYFISLFFILSFQDAHLLLGPSVGSLPWTGFLSFFR